MQGADQGFEHQLVCTVTRRLALRRSSRRETTNECGASSPAVTCAAEASVIEFVAPSLAVTFTASTPVIEYVDPSPAVTCAAPVTEHASSSPAPAYGAPDTVIEYVAPSPAGICTAPAPVTCMRPSLPPTPASDYVDSSLAASVTRAEATFEISGADGGGDADFPAEVQPVVEAVISESTDVTERWGDADTSETMTEMSEDDAVTSTALELDVVLDALSELSGDDGSDWVRARRVQELTSLRLWRLEELLEDWERMGVIRRDDTGLLVAFCPSVEDTLNDEDCWW